MTSPRTHRACRQTKLTGAGQQIGQASREMSDVLPKPARLWATNNIAPSPQPAMPQSLHYDPTLPPLLPPTPSQPCRPLTLLPRTKGQRRRAGGVLYSSGVGFYLMFGSCRKRKKKKKKKKERKKEGKKTKQKKQKRKEKEKKQGPHGSQNSYRRCVKVEVAVLGSPSLPRPYGLLAAFTSGAYFLHNGGR